MPLTSARYKNHFSAGGDYIPGGYDELTDGLYDFESAFTVAGDRIAQAGVNYLTHQDLASAYWWFGRTLHLLQDSTVPAHVHNDPHISLTNDDQYEVYVTPGTGSNYHEYFRFDPANGDSWNFQDWASGYWSTPASVTILGSNPQALWNRSDDYASLEGIFRETTDYTDDYDSDDYDGDCHDSSQAVFPSARLEELARSADPSTHNDWGVAVRRSGVDLEPWEVSVLARDVGTWAVEQSALFMRMYYSELGKVLPNPTNMQTDRFGMSSIELGWDSVVGSDGYAADGYAVYRSTSPDSGFTWVGNTADANYRDTELNLETTYYYRVYAYNDVAGLGSSYTTVSGTIRPPDINSDGDVDCDDVNLLSTAIATGGTNLEDYDFNDNGGIELADLHQWLALAGEVNLGSGLSYLQADADLNGVVDVSDFNLWNQYKFTGIGVNGGGGLWCHGDFNADGSVDVSDFNLWNGNKFTTSRRLTLDFDAQPLGTFSHLEEDGFTLDYIGFGDLQEVVNLGDGDRVLVDSDPENSYGAMIVIQRTDGLTFFLDSLFASDLTNDPSTSYGRIDVSGFSAGNWVETQLSPTSSLFTQYFPEPLMDLELDQLRINLVGSTRDNFSVDDITITVTHTMMGHTVPLIPVLDRVSSADETRVATRNRRVIDLSTLDTLTLEVGPGEPQDLARVDKTYLRDRLSEETAGRSYSAPLVTHRSSIGRHGLDESGNVHRKYPVNEQSDPKGQENDMMAGLDVAFALWNV